MPPPAVVAHFAVKVISDLGGRETRNWLVSYEGHRAVLRRYPDQSEDAVRYEARVLQEMDSRGWPVPMLLAEPVRIDGRMWGLTRWLDGSRPEETDRSSRRARGELLAQLHTESEELVGVVGQRDGWMTAEKVVGDPALHEHLALYAQIRPDEKRFMHWHADRAQELFDGADLARARLAILHSDFVPWNLLYNGTELTGVLDFESTHCNYAVADFALAWRGWNDDVIHGYDAVRPLDDIDWAILTPTYWSWLFLGASDAIALILAGNADPSRLEWVLKKLSLRSPLMGEHASPYPG